MDIQQLKEHAKYCYEIDDLPALAVDGFSLGQDTQAFRPVELA